MRGLRDSVGAKVLAWVLLVCAVYAAALLGLKLLESMSYADDADSYQDTAEFYRLLRNRENRVAGLFAIDRELLSQELSYVERRRLTDELEQESGALDAEHTNFRFIVRDSGGERVYSNLAEGEALSGFIYYASFREGDHAALAAEDGGYLETASTTEWSENDAAPPESAAGQARPVYAIECGIGSLEVFDEFWALNNRFHDLRDNLSRRIVLTAACFLLSVLCLCHILWTSGHRAGTEELILHWQDQIFLELYLWIVGTAAIAAAAGAYGTLEWLYFSAPQSEEWIVRPCCAALCALTAVLFALILRTLAARAKVRALARTSLLCRVLIWLWTTGRDFILGLPITWRVAAGFLAYCGALVLCFALRYSVLGPMLFLLLNTAALLALCRWAYYFRRLREGSDAIAAGDLSYHIDTARMPRDLKLHAEALNNISAGLQNAVNEQMKSERFKAELITNVSHDLKTPLTSIINYVDLLKTTEQTDPRAEEYIEVLDRKAQRLKKLTEDLVEASKASTGVLSVHREKLGMSQLIDQSLGEYRERLEDRRLALVTALPEEETYVYADGRHLWRVIDNLLSNCCKYALEGTRVYLELARGHGQVTLSVKNISRDALNVPPEQLMERFVRGDVSRSTEGSGLGLSIARSLTELQGGTFQLAVDGDLFKAIVTLPQAN